MKKSIILVSVACLLGLAMLFSFGVPSKSFAGEVTLEWDKNIPDPDGYLLYMKDGSAAYDYNSPIVITGITNGAGDIPSSISKVTIDGLGIMGQDITYSFVVRAFLDKTAGRIVSGDSNEVGVRFDYILPPVATTLTAAFDENTGEVTVVWQQANSALVTLWNIFISETPGGPYTLFDSIQNTGQSQPTITKPISVPDGERKVFYIVIVSYRSQDLFSAYSAEVSVDIDKRTVTPPAGLREVKVTIPVTN